MPLVFAGVASHAPGITGRADQADPDVRDRFYEAFDQMRADLRATEPDAIVVVAAEHFANFFMNNMPSFAVGMCDFYDGPIEDPAWLGIDKVRIPGDRALSQRFIEQVMQTADVAYAEEWKFDHGIMVPLHFLTPEYDIPIIPANINCQGPPLTPLHRAWNFGESLRAAADALPERIALVGTGGISHWPATPDSGKINEAWDRDFLDRWARNDRSALLDYDDTSIYRDAGQGGFEIRTFLTVSAAARGATGTVHFYAPIPIFAVGCTVATYDLGVPEAGTAPIVTGTTSAR
ncbi:MAG: extradiol ring-cleavage dioxygenase [Actinomycetota bacterium]